jgi:hypothetical protein
LSQDVAKYLSLHLLSHHPKKAKKKKSKKIKIRILLLNNCNVFSKYYMLEL